MAAAQGTGADSAVKRIECPRCGYDQRGEVSQWTNRCPMTGTCNECGLELCWSQVFTHSRHPWLFEYQWRERPVRRLLVTVFRTATPRRFWTDVRLEDPVYLRPVAIIVAILVIVFLIGYTLMGVSVILSSFGGIDSLSDPGVVREIFEEVRMRWWSELSGALASPVLVIFIMPLTFLMLPITLRRARVHFRHVARIGLYAMGAPFLFAVAWVLVQMVMHLGGMEDAAESVNPWRWVPYGGHSILYLRPYTLIGIGLGAMCAIWMSFWWWIACRRYLRLPSAGVTVVLMAFVALLAGATGHIHLSMM